MRSLPIFLAWVRTWRYRLRRAATPTVNRSATATPCVAVCNTAPIVPARIITCVGPLEARTLCVQFTNKRGLVEVIDEGPLAVDLDHRQPLAVAHLELRHAPDVHLFEVELVLPAHRCKRLARTLAEMAVVCVVNGDPTDKDPGSSSPRRPARPRARTRRGAWRCRDAGAPPRSPRTPWRRSPSASR